MKNLLLIFLLAPLLSAAQVPPKPNTNAVAQAVTLVGTNIMPIAVRSIVEGWFEAGNVTTQDVESAISARGYTTTNDVLDLLAVTGTNLLEQLNVAQTNLQAAINAEAAARAAGDSVALTNWQARVNALTNGAALGASALQPPATNTLAAAAAHAATAHGVTEYGGFRGGGGDNYAQYGGAVGSSASTRDGGSVGRGAYTTDGGAVGYGAQTMDGGAVGRGAYAEYGGAVGRGAYAEYGGAVGQNAYAEYGGAVGAGAHAAEGGAVGYSAYTTDGGAVGHNAKTSDGFAGGKGAFATTDGTYDGEGIDAIQLGIGGNSEPFTLQIYSNRLLNADGTIPVERFAATLNASNAADRAYADARIAAEGCTANGTGATLVITGAPPPIAWQAVPSGALAVSVAANAPRNRFYSITSIGKPVSSWPAGTLVSTNSSGTSPFHYALGPYTGTLWQAVGGGR